MPVTIRVPGTSAKFPAVCANCLQPATTSEKLSAQRSTGRYSEKREVQVPLCDACHHLYVGDTPFHRRVALANKLITVGIAGIVVFGLGVVGFGYAASVISSSPNVAERAVWPWFALAIAAVVLIAFAVVYVVARRQAVAPLPAEETAAKDCVRLAAFTSSDSTFALRNEEYARRFREENPGSQTA